jgi:hypothetical protein
VVKYLSRMTPRDPLYAGYRYPAGLISYAGTSQDTAAKFRTARNQAFTTWPRSPACRWPRNHACRRPHSTHRAFRYFIDDKLTVPIEAGLAHRG